MRAWTATLSIHVNAPGLSGLLVLRDEETYPEEVCKPEHRQAFVAGYRFDPKHDVSHGITTLHVECSSKIVVWAQFNDGRFARAEKNLRAFIFNRQ